jgi:hypothetical protein
MMHRRQFLALAAAGAVAASTRASFAATTSLAEIEAAIAAGGAVFIHVTAPWCGTCKRQKPIVAELLAKREYQGCRRSMWTSTVRATCSRNSECRGKPLCWCSRTAKKPAGLSARRTLKFTGARSISYSPQIPSLARRCMASITVSGSRPAFRVE